MRSCAEGSDSDKVGRRVWRGEGKRVRGESIRKGRGMRGKMLVVGGEISRQNLVLRAARLKNVSTSRPTPVYEKIK